MKHQTLRKILALVLVLCLTAVLLPPPSAQAAGGVEMSVTVPHTQTDSTMANYFTFAAGQWTAGNASHVWSNTPAADNPRATYYEVHFTGHKIDVYAGKNAPMGKVEYFIDGESRGVYSLYRSSNIDYDLIATFDNLDEGPHVFRAEATGEKDSSATGTLIDCAKVVVYYNRSLTEPLYGAIVDDDLQYVQEDIDAAFDINGTGKSLHAWRGDTAVSQLLLAAGNNDLHNLTVTAGDFTDGNGHTIPAEQVKLDFIKIVQAYTDMPGWATVPARPVPTGSRAEAAEVLMGDDPVDLSAGKVQGVWVSIQVPEDAEPGQYSGEIAVTADGLAANKRLTFRYNLSVAESVLPAAETFKDGFDIELWQNPYASAEYYGVTPFSALHLEILKPIMEKYKSIGGHAITTTIVDEAWNGQTYSANDVHIPSMIKWTKATDGTWRFDYSEFDTWVNFNKNTIGIGDKIVCYSTAPWTNAISYFDVASNTTKTISNSSSSEWNAAWTALLTDLMAHAEANGWKDQIYIGIDERGFSTAAFDLIDSVVGSDGEPFKTAGAMDGFVNQRALAMRVDDLNVGSIAVKGHPAEFASLLADREAAGLRTTVYSCTGHIPGNFSLSAPGESYWTMLYSYSVGGVGFLRWAYDSWVEDPLRDTTHCNFEAGDCFLIFPDEKTAANPVAHSSLRLEKMAQGVRDVNKLMIIKENCPAMEDEVDALLATVKPTYDSSGYYLTEAGKTALAADMATIRAKIAQLTQEYEERLALGDTKKLNIRPKDVPLVVLPEQYQGDVWGPDVKDGSRQYLGQPDMITLTDGTLVTVFPVGHGHGPLVMMKSENRGENWEEIDTPDSWARSLETPTMYRLNFTDGTTRYVMITARPNWDYNTGTGKGGWDASISDDGIHWSEAATYQEDVGYTIVAMASLVQLKDENGNWMDKWMGVFHNYSFVNYKTYLTFDEDGNMQWSTPEPYLSEYRDYENKYHICEVGMFRSPDGSRIVALARSDYHNNVHASTMFWSDDEGETWTRPMELPGALAGERHKALYDPVSGRLVITFREIIWDTNNNGVFEGENDWLAGDWIAWVGTYEDLMERNEGQYRILLDEDWANNRYSGDTGYTGMAVYPDGTFVLDTYGHWDKEFSQTQGYDVRQDRCWIRRAKFTLDDIDRLYKTSQASQTITEEVDSTILAANARANSWKVQPEGSTATDGGPEWAFDDATHWWHSNYTSTDFSETNKNGQNPSETNPIWIQTGFGEKRDIKSISYQGRTNGNADIINAYELYFACMDDPTATPTDADFGQPAATGNFADNRNPQTVTLDTAVKATHMRLVAKGTHRPNGYVSAQRIRVYAVKPVEPKSDAAELTSLTVNGQSVAIPANGTDLGVIPVTGSAATLSAAVSPKATVSLVVKGVPASAAAPIALENDVTLVSVRVLAEDGATQKVYTLALTKANNSNAQLRKLDLGPLKLYPAFDPAVTEYTAVAYGNKAVPLTAIAAQPGAALTYETVTDYVEDTVGSLNGVTCRFFQHESLVEDGKLINPISVTVTSPDGTAATTYIVKVEVRASVYLSDFAWATVTGGNTPIRDKAWGYQEMALIGAGGAKLSSQSGKGLGTRANTNVEYDLSDTGFDSLSARVGVSYSQRSSSNAPDLTFRVLLDGEEARSVSSQYNQAAPETFTVALDTANKLTISTTSNKSSANDADGNWMDAVLTSAIPNLANEDVFIQYLEFEGDSPTIYVNQNDENHTVTLMPVVKPIGVDHSNHQRVLTWTSSNDTIATVNGGVVAAVKPGTVTITATALSGASASMEVIVRQKLEGQVAVSGETKFGSELTADVNDIANEAKDTLTYAWYRGETADGDVLADTKTYTPVKEDIGSKLTVKVTAHDPYDGETTATTAVITKADGYKMLATPTHTNVSAEGAEDGEITGLFKGRAYQYLLWDREGLPGDDADWKDFIDESEVEQPGEGQTHGTAKITGLGVGSYLVRRAADDTHFAGPVSNTVTIAVRSAAQFALSNPHDFDGGVVQAGRTQIPEADTVRLWVTPDTGYELDILTVTTDGGESFTPTWDEVQDCYTFTMPADNVTINATFTVKTYTIEHKLTFFNCDLGAEETHVVTHGEPFSITFTPDEGYELPVSLSRDSNAVTETATGRRFTAYTYTVDPTDSAKRVMTFDRGVTCDITITGTATPKRYTVVYDLTNGVLAPDAPQTAAHGADLTITLKAARGYTLPGAVAVTVNGAEPEGVSYDAQTGVLVISGAAVTGNVTIAAQGTAQDIALQTITLVGPARVGRTLTANTVPVLANVEYQWLLVDQDGNETEIEGATESTYEIPADAEGKTIKVRVTGIDGYNGELTSASTSPILPAAEPFVYVETVSLNTRDASVTVGSSITLRATTEPDNATSPILFWTSGNEAIATVNQNGKVTGIAEGTVTITVSSTDRLDTVSTTCYVTVTPSKSSGGTSTSTHTPSTITTVDTRGDGSKVTTVTTPDGTVTQTVQQPDGTKTEAVTTKDGDKTITVTDPEGEELAKVEIPAAIPAPETEFIDISTTPWAKEAINNVAGLKLVEGVGGNKYDPIAPMTRGALATVLHRFSNGDTNYKTTFVDIVEGKYYTDGVAWAAKAGVVTGYTEEIFAPDDTITREQLAVMMARYAKLIGLDVTAKADSLNAFVDGDKTGSWAVDGVAWCVEKGILLGKGNNTLDPNAQVTRAEVAVMLDRFIGIIK